MTVLAVYLVRCDSCNEILRDPVNPGAEMSFERSFIREKAVFRGWSRDKKKDFCPDCSKNEEQD